MIEILEGILVAYGAVISVAIGAVVSMGIVIWLSFSEDRQQRQYLRKMLKRQKQEIRLRYKSQKQEIKLKKKLEKIRSDPDYKAWMKAQNLGF